MGLLERERAWMRPRRMAEWDELGGPSRRLRWLHRHRTPVGMALLVGTLTYGLALGPLRLWTLVVPPAVWWWLRTDAGLAAEWDARGPQQATGDPPPRGWFERASVRQQLRSDDENRLHEQGRWEESMSPATHRLHTVWLIWFGVGAVLAVVAAIEAMLR